MKIQSIFIAGIFIHTEVIDDSDFVYNDEVPQSKTSPKINAFYDGKS